MENLSKIYKKLTKRERQMLVYLYTKRFSRRPPIHAGMLPFISVVDAKQAALHGAFVGKGPAGSGRRVVGRLIRKLFPENEEIQGKPIKQWSVEAVVALYQECLYLR